MVVMVRVVGPMPADTGHEFTIIIPSWIFVALSTYVQTDLFHVNMELVFGMAFNLRIPNITPTLWYYLHKYRELHKTIKHSSGGWW